MYPTTSAARDRFILDRRGSRPPHDAWRFQGLVVEDERTAEGSIARVATVFLTGRECPWRCVMCDLWRYTTTSDTPQGAIAAQVAAARTALADRLDRVTHMKLYNAGNFFDPRSVPEGDYRDIAAALAGMDRAIVESHPSLIGPRVDRFVEALGRRREPGRQPQLEIAMGLETAHPTALEQLHKHITLEKFSAAAEYLRARGIALRVFLLISPPFVPHEEQDVWLLHSIDVAFSSGATVVSLIPTRSGNGAMEALAAEGAYRAPDIDDIERSVDCAYRQRLQHPPASEGRIVVDLWDLDQVARCPHCLDARRARLHTMNLEQRRLPHFSCAHCDGGAA